MLLPTRVLWNKYYLMLQMQKTEAQRTQAYLAFQRLEITESVSVPGKSGSHVYILKNNDSKKHQGRLRWGLLHD